MPTSYQCGSIRGTTKFLSSFLLGFAFTKMEGYMDVAQPDPGRDHYEPGKLARLLIIHGVNAINRYAGSSASTQILTLFFMFLFSTTNSCYIK